jgi:hypothetical protein
MPFPVVPVVIGSGLLALIAAGQAEGKKSTSSSSSSDAATPTQQSTGGPAGGAQAPSHSDLGNATTSADIMTAPGPSSTPVTDFVSSAIDAADAPAPKATMEVDTWAPSEGPSFTKPASQVDATSALGSTAGLTTRAVADTFTTLGRTFGGIW